MGLLLEKIWGIFHIHFFDDLTLPQPWRLQLEPLLVLQLPAKHGVVSCLSTGAAWKIRWQGYESLGNMDISWVEQSNVCAIAKWQHRPRRVKREQAGSFCETLASYPNDLRFNMFTLRKLFICTVLRNVARSCTYHFTTKFGDPWLLAQHIPTSSTSLSLLSLLLLLLPPLVLLLLLLSWACCKGAAAPAH